MNTLTTLFSYFAQVVFLAVVIYFAIYVVLELRVLLISRQVEKRKLTELARTTAPVEDNFHPSVSVLLPICNESAVVQRLIDAVCRLQYPAQFMEILVLDDSSDHTSKLAQARVNHFAQQGVNIRLIRRNKRKHFKAGNLLNGIQESSGEFFAIFDADFVPPEDFLLRTMPYFKDPALGFLQTGIDYENRDVSFLTRFQAMEMGHQQYVTVGLSEDGNMASLSGSSCVWRKTCVEALGGWNATTATEDVDLGYRAQFGHWKYAYLPDVISMSMLPESISAFRTQRERWGRGLIHSAFKHALEMFQQSMPLMKRLHAISMMFSAPLLASIYVLILLSLPLSFIVNLENANFQWIALIFFGLVAIWALNNVLGARQSTRIDGKACIFHISWDGYRYVCIFLPMAWYYFAGGVRALLGIRGEFHRTPKGHDEHPASAPLITRVLMTGEIFTFFYSLLTMLVACQHGNYFLVPMNFTVCVGFGMTLFWSWQEKRKHA